MTMTLPTLNMFFTFRSILILKTRKLSVLSRILTQTISDYWPTDNQRIFSDPQPAHILVNSKVSELRCTKYKPQSLLEDYWSL